MKLLNKKEIEEAAKVAAGFDKNKEIDYDELDAILVIEGYKSK